MKQHAVPLKILFALVALAACSSVNSGKTYAQEGSILRTGEQYVPRSSRDLCGNPVADGNLSPRTHQRPQLQPPDFANPTVFNSGFQNEGVIVDPYAGQVTVSVGRNRIKDSGLDANRGIIDPSSLQIVNRYERDQYGIQWQITWGVWTSYGRPHSELKRS